MDIGTGMTCLSGAAVIVAGILKFAPTKKTICSTKYVTVREFEIWQEGFDKRWDDLSGWIGSISADVKTLTRRRE